MDLRDVMTFLPTVGSAHCDEIHYLIIGVPQPESLSSAL